MRALNLDNVIVSKPSTTERVSQFVPLFGWMVASRYFENRFKPASQALFEQLKERGEFPKAAWAHLESRLIAEAWCKIIENWFGWPCGNLIPEDPIDLVFFHDDGAFENMINDFETYSKTKIWPSLENLSSTEGNSVSFGRYAACIHDCLRQTNICDAKFSTHVLQKMTMKTDCPKSG